MDLRKIVEELSVEELCGQVLAYDVQPEDTEEETLKIIDRIRPGALFLVGSKEKTVADLAPRFERDKRFAEYAKRTTGFPLLVCTDVEHGPGSYCKPLPELSNPMSWGACNDEKLIERAGELTGRICRKVGVHYALAPMIDLCFNFRNPTIQSRAISDDPDRVIRIAGAYVRGLQKNNYLAACIKHFPGSGVDERNGHFVTETNSLSKEEWMATYGKTYKELMKMGVASVMVGHVSCPAFQPDEIDEYGALPCTLSKNLMTDLLKGELGFEGCVISDAMSMIGACACVGVDKLAVSFIKAGGDLILFPEPQEYDYLVEAVKSGEIPMERIRDAVYRVLKLKERVRLFEDADIDAEIGDIGGDIQELEEVSQKIAENAVKIVRNNVGVLPIKKNKGKVLIVKVGGSFFNTQPNNAPFMYMEKEFEEQGWEVSSLFFAKHRQLKELLPKHDLVVAACHSNIHGSTLRVGWDNMMAFWRGYVLQHPNLVFVSLDDPFKLFDFPYAKTYINTFGTAPALQRCAVKLILGQIESKGKNPVSFQNYFQRED